MSKRILLVNAEVAQRRRRSAALKAAGFEIVERDGGLDALIALNTYAVEGRPIAAMVLGEVLSDLGVGSLLNALWSRWPEFPVCATAATSVEDARLKRCLDPEALLGFLKAHALDVEDAPRAVYVLARFRDPLAAVKRLGSLHPLCHAVRDARAQLLLRVEAAGEGAIEAAIEGLDAVAYERLDVVSLQGLEHLRGWTAALHKPPHEPIEGDGMVDWLLDCSAEAQPRVYAHLLFLREVERVDALAGGRLIASARGSKARLSALLEEVMARPGVGRVREMKVIGDL